MSIKAMESQDLSENCTEATDNFVNDHLTINYRCFAWSPNVMDEDEKKTVLGNTQAFGVTSG